MNNPENYLNSIRHELQKYRSYGENTFTQLDSKDIHWRYTETDNSIAIIVKHMVGNMLSRFSNFLTEDGEKSWRQRDSEFENPYAGKHEMMAAWEKGWDCLIHALDSINKDSFGTTITIRNEQHTIVEAVNRQLAHYASHIGQIIFIGKMIKGKSWKSLSIPKGQSEAYNKIKFENR